MFDMFAILAVYCLFSGLFGEVLAQSESPPRILTRNGELEVWDGERGRLLCNVSGQPTPRILWYRDGTLLAVHTMKRFMLNRKNKRLVINPVTINDTAEYACLAENEHGKTWVNTTLIVHERNSQEETSEWKDENREPLTEGPPRWQRRKSDAILYTDRVGRSVNFSCPAEGIPAPNITWTRDSMPVWRIDGRIIKKKWRFMMRNVISKDSGNYTCIVANKHGSISWTHVLHVVEKLDHSPIFHRGKPHNKSAPLGSTVKFECHVMSDSAPKLHWIEHYEVNGSYYHPENKAPYFRELNLTSPGNPEVLVLKNVTYEQSGWYTCVAANSFGVSHKSAWLEIIPPARPTVLPNGIDNSGPMVLAITILTPLLCLLLILLAVFVIKKKRRHVRTRIPRKRVVIMKPNLLYSETDYYGVFSKSSTALLVPQVRVEGGHGGTDLASLSHYLIPLDKKWEIARENIKLGPKVGCGAFGQVFRAEAHHYGGSSNPITVAVKTLKDDATDREMADLIQEMEVMKLMGRHPNIISLLGCCTRENPLFVVAEYAANGNLRDFLRSRRPSTSMLCPLLLKDLVSFAHQVARGMEYLSSNQCIHRDLAARNVLVSEDNILKIADFGLARNIHNTDYYRKTTDGRLPVKWMAPEALFLKKYTTKSDVWSFGILLWEIFSFGGSPYPSVPLEQLFELLKDGHRMEQPACCPPDVYKTMISCWQENPRNRPLFNQLVKILEHQLLMSSNEEYLMVDIFEHAISCAAGSDSQYSSMTHSSCESLLDRNHSSQA